MLNGKKLKTSKLEWKIIIKLRKEGELHRAIVAFLYRIKRMTHYMIKVYNTDRNIANKSRSERRKKLDLRREISSSWGNEKFLYNIYIEIGINDCCKL